MIFVTVGTHEQQFDRLVAAIDHMVGSGAVADSVYIQTGYSTHIPSHCQWSQFLSYIQMQEFIERAEVVVTHGGPSSFMAVRAMGKTPVVVPRQSSFREHVNDHQVGFVTKVAERVGGIIPVFDIATLPEAILLARQGSDAQRFVSHNRQFCADLRQCIEEL